MCKKLEGVRYKIMNLDELRNDIIIKQKKGLPFIIASVVIWLLITVVAALQIDIYLKNILVFCCSMPLLPLSWIIGKKIGVDIFSKENELGSLGFFVYNESACISTHCDVGI